MLAKVLEVQERGTSKRKKNRRKRVELDRYGKGCKDISQQKRYTFAKGRFFSKSSYKELNSMATCMATITFSVGMYV